MTADPEWRDGEWVPVDMRKFKFMCCGCRLVHRMNVKVTHEGDKHVVWVQMHRDNRATAAARKGSPKALVVES